MTVRRCVFCVNPITNRTASREDTVPRWLQEELAIADASVEPTLTSPTGEQLDQRIHPVDQLRTGGVCRRCNSGWMSRLESEAKPIITASLKSERHLRSLARRERQLVARWAVKTAFMLDVGGLESRVPPQQLRALFENQPHIPPSVFVFARQQPATRPWYFVEGAWWKHGPLTAEAAAEVEKHSYKIAMQFGDLILVVAFWPLTGWYHRVEKGELVKLWPVNAVTKDYVHPQGEDLRDSAAACHRFLITIGVVPRLEAEGYAHD